MNTMEMTKIVGAICGSLLVFLLIQTVAHGLFNTESEAVGYAVPVEEGAGGEAEPAEEVDVAALLAEADPAAGESQFRKCAACHKLDGTDGVGPHLNGVMGRDVASVDGFGYSDAMASHEGDWTPEEIFHFIENPRGYVPGTAMAFAGIKPADDRADLIAYLQALAN
jgi:cytochrome c